MNEENQNLQIWNHAGKTDPKYTKKRTDGAKLTTIRPYYQIEKATELWGPYGDRWEAEFIEISFLDYIKPPTKWVLEPQPLKKAIGKYHFKYPISENKEHKFTVLVDWLVHEDDFLMKMQTKAITKALSMLGWNNDIFKGEFDDPAYVEERVASQAELDAAEKTEKALKRNKISEYKTKLVGLVQAIEDEKEQASARDMLNNATAEGVFAFDKFNEERVKAMIETLERVIAAQSESKEKSEKKKSNKKEPVKSKKEK